MPVLRILTRGLLLITLATVVVFALWRLDLIDFSMIGAAFINNAGMVIALMVTQTILYIMLMYRYVAIVKAFSIRAKLTDMMAATFVSVAIGQWAPGALAFMEMIRLGLMFGSDKLTEKPREHADEVAGSTRQRLVVASFYDRLVGFFVILSIGLAVLLGLAVYSFIAQSKPPSTGVVLLLIFSGAGSLGILTLPLLARHRLSASTLSFMIAKCTAAAKKGNRKSLQILTSVLRQLEGIRTILATGGADYRKFTLPSLLSSGAVLLMILSTYFAALAIGVEIPFLAIAAALPVISVAGLLPLGFAGIGAYQVVTIIVFNVFAVDPKVASSANLLQNALSLVVSTILGIIFARISFKQLREIFALKQ